MKQRNKAKALILIIGDYAILFGGLLLTLALRYYGVEDDAAIRTHYIPFAIIFALWIIVFGSFGLYDLTFMKNSRQFLLRLLRAMGVNFVLAILFFYLIPVFEIEPRRNLLFIAILGTIFLFLWRFCANLFFVRVPASRIMFLGITNEALELAQFLKEHPQLGHKPVVLATVDDSTEAQMLLPSFSDQEPIPHIKISNNLTGAIQKHLVDTIVITRDIKENRTFVKMLFEAIPLGVSVVEFTAFHEMTTGKIPMSLIEELWFLENLVGSRERMYEFFKRGLDILLSIIVGAPAIILAVPVAILIKFTSRGPVFFRQNRIGKNGKVFELIKFRSMVRNAEEMSGFKENGSEDPRHTTIGTFLRINYLDELPQIINILKGEMSFIGPRPERPHYVEDLKKQIPFYEMRLLVPPGITGWAQIHMEDDASVEDAPEKMQYDLYYIKNRSLVLDLLIALKTAFTLLQRSGR